MSNPRLAPGKGSSPRIVVSVSDDQRQALDALSAHTARSMAQITREALAEWLINHPFEEVAEAS
jgi:predicted DNA-binding protein